MKSVGRVLRSRAEPSRELTALRARLLEAQETLHAIQSGGVDALVVVGKHGPRVYTLEGAEHAYRVLIETMNEGAVTLSPGGVVLYANKCFARMVKHPLEKITGYPFQRFLAPGDHARLKKLLKGRSGVGSRTQMTLQGGEGRERVPVRISSIRLAKDGSGSSIFGMVVTDITETQQIERKLRALSQRLVQAQENERLLVALELHDNVTQDLCAINIRFQELVDRIPARKTGAWKEALGVRELLAEAIRKVQRISSELWPHMLDNLGLVPALCAAEEEFVKRTGVRIKLTCTRLSPPQPAGANLALYRIFEEALRNIEKHARARYVTARLTQRGAFAELTIKDDGLGFDPDHPPAKRKEEGGLGLLRMRERAEFLGGVLTIKSARRAGTEIKVRIPLSEGGPVIG